MSGPGLESGPVALESSALTMRPPCLYNLIFFSLKKLSGPEGGPGGGPEGGSRFCLQPNDTAPEMIVTVKTYYHGL